MPLTERRYPCGQASSIKQVSYASGRHRARLTSRQASLPVNVLMDYINFTTSAYSRRRAAIPPNLGASLSAYIDGA